MTEWKGPFETGLAGMPGLNELRKEERNYD